MTTLSESAIHPEISSRGAAPRGSFIDDLAAYATEHHAQHWRGTFAEFLRDILPKDPAKLTRTSHQYIYDMLCDYRDAQHLESGAAPDPSSSPKQLFAGELFPRGALVPLALDLAEARRCVLDGDDIVH